MHRPESGLSIEEMVDETGIEPATSSLRIRLAPCPFVPLRDAELVWRQCVRPEKSFSQHAVTRSDTVRKLLRDTQEKRSSATGLLHLLRGIDAPVSNRHPRKMDLAEKPRADFLADKRAADRCAPFSPTRAKYAALTDSSLNSTAIA